MAFKPVRQDEITQGGNINKKGSGPKIKSWAAPKFTRKWEGTREIEREQPERWKEDQDCWCPSRYVEGDFQVIQPGVMARDAHAYPSKQHGVLKTISSILLNKQILQ